MKTLLWFGSLTTSSWSRSWSRSRSRSRSIWEWSCLGCWDWRFLRTKKPARVAERNMRISLSGHIFEKCKKCVFGVESCGFRNGKRKSMEGGCSWSFVKFGCSSRTPPLFLLSFTSSFSSHCDYWIICIWLLDLN